MGLALSSKDRRTRSSRRACRNYGHAPSLSCKWRAETIGRTVITNPLVTVPELLPDPTESAGLGKDCVTGRALMQ